MAGVGANLRRSPPPRDDRRYKAGFGAGAVVQVKEARQHKGRSQHRVARRRDSGEPSARPNRAHRPLLSSHKGPRGRAPTQAWSVEHVPPRRRACQGQRAGGQAGVSAKRFETAGGGGWAGSARPNGFIDRDRLRFVVRAEKDVALLHAQASSFFPTYDLRRAKAPYCKSDLL